MSLVTEKFFPNFSQIWYWWISQTMRNFDKWKLRTDLESPTIGEWIGQLDMDKILANQSETRNCTATAFIGQIRVCLEELSHEISGFGWKSCKQDQGLSCIAWIHQNIDQIVIELFYSGGGCMSTQFTYRFVRSHGFYGLRGKISIFKKLSSQCLHSQVYIGLWITDW